MSATAGSSADLAGEHLSGKLKLSKVLKMDEIFNTEQEHLSAVYERLQQIHVHLMSRLKANEKRAAKDVHDMHEELALDFEDDVMDQETLVEIKEVSDIIDIYNQQQESIVADIKNSRLLLEQPYFAKVKLYFPKLKKEDDIYIGKAAMSDPDSMEQIVIDWRSPVAETYYNQANGATSYMANGREIHCELRSRRQFDIYRDKLKSYFDTTVAIQDPLLLKALSAQHSDKLRDITQTIQKEQNEIIRYKDVEVMLVSGIAGSGKTSVMLQRIAWLLYQDRKNLDASQVALFSPSALFESYISDVLPGMGEKNPISYTWDSFTENFHFGQRAMGNADSYKFMQALEEKVQNAHLKPNELNPICINEYTLINSGQIMGIINKFKDIPLSARLSSLVCDELHARLDKKLKKMAKDESIRIEIETLEIQDMRSIFGHMVNLDDHDEESAVHLINLYVEKTYGMPAHKFIDDAKWISFDKLGIRLLNISSLDVYTWLYLRLLVADVACRSVRFVMVDEVQDYSKAQLMILAKHFSKAHFLLLGDENQAIYEDSIDFASIRSIFENARGQVDELHLLTSYRCTPEVTSQFVSLINPDSSIHINSVQRKGSPADTLVFADEKNYYQTLQEKIDEFNGGFDNNNNGEHHASKAAKTKDEALEDEALEDDEHHDESPDKRHGERPDNKDAKAKDGLCAIICAGKKCAKHLSEKLDGAQLITSAQEPLPSSGVIIINLALAKGLEFDQVIIPDADAHTYPDTALSRRRLYTAISRATHDVSIYALEKLSPLLK